MSEENRNLNNDEEIILNEELEEYQGSTRTGRKLVIFLGPIGWLIALLGGKKKTRKGANITMIVWVILVLVLILMGYFS